MDNAFAYVRDYGICSGSSYSYVGYVSLLALQNYINLWPCMLFMHTYKQSLVAKLKGFQTV